MYILYSYPVSTHSRRVAALLEELGMSYESRIVDLVAGESMSPDYLAINPNHQVPTLIDGSLRIHESNAILRYLCTKHSRDDWYPTDLDQRVRTEQWLDWNQCRLGPSVSDIVLNKVFLGDRGDKAAIARGEERLPESLDILNDGLAGRDFLIGERPTIADLSVGSNITHLSFAKAAPTQVHIKNWIARVCAIDGFRKTLPSA